MPGLSAARQEVVIISLMKHLVSCTLGIIPLVGQVRVDGQLDPGCQGSWELAFIASRYQLKTHFRLSVHRRSRGALLIWRLILTSVWTTPTT